MMLKEDSEKGYVALWSYEEQNTTVKQVSKTLYYRLSSGNSLPRSLQSTRETYHLTQPEAMEDHDLDLGFGIPTVLRRDARRLRAVPIFLTCKKLEAASFGLGLLRITERLVSQASTIFPQALVGLVA